LTFSSVYIKLIAKCIHYIMWLKEIEKQIKGLFLKLLRLFLKNSPLKKEEVHLSLIKKILVVRQDERIGNLVLLTPFLMALRKAFPQAQITFLASKTFHTLFSDSDLVEEILVLHKKMFIFNPLSLFLFIRKLRSQRFDLAFDLSDEDWISVNNTMYTYLSKALYRVGHKREHSDLFLNLEVPKPRDTQRHAVEMHLDLLRFLIGEVESNSPTINALPQSKKIIQDYLSKRNVSSDDFLVGINLGGRGKKRWGKNNFLKLADWVKKEYDCKIIFIWGPEEKQLVRGFSLRKDEILSDIFPVPVLAALIERCQLFISSDTGAMHLSCAVGIPTLAIFLDSDAVKYGPRGEKHRSIIAKGGNVSFDDLKMKIIEMTGETIGTNLSARGGSA
jgi:heptosyltransferase III